MSGRIYPIQSLIDLIDTGKRSFEEDKTHENGNYQNKCSLCGEVFFGHKRRVICKVCENDNKRKI